MDNQDLQKLSTERVNERTRDIDQLTSLGILKTINQEDQTVPKLIEESLEEISHLVDKIFACLKKGGRLIYVGAGTSGRLGVLDASECPPTYGVSPDLVQGLIAGGNEAMFKAKEGVEDSRQAGQEDLLAISLSDQDFVMGLAASGRTPYVLGAIEYAQKLGAMTGGLSCVADSQLGRLADYSIEIVTGPEVITGSTRMKAGTAQKLVLNMISTTLMVKMGKVYQNYMVDVQPTNSKLEHRAIHLIEEILGVDSQRAEELYQASDKHVKVAIVMDVGKISKDAAEDLLESHQGHIRRTLESIGGR